MTGAKGAWQQASKDGPGVAAESSHITGGRKRRLIRNGMGF